MYIRGKNGKPLSHWVATFMGDFNRGFFLFRYPQIKGIQWHRDIVPALKRYARKNLGLKSGGYCNVDGVMLNADETLGFFDHSTQLRVDYNTKSKCFETLSFLPIDFYLIPTTFV